MGSFVRLNKTVNHKGEIIPLELLRDRKKLYSEYIRKDDNADWYTSLFIYTEDAKNYHSKRNSIAEYAGTATADYLFFDLDNKGDLETARLETVALLKNLKNQLGVESVRQHVNVYFSGSKGFHVYLHTEQVFNVEEMKHFCAVLAKDIKSFDSQIYNTTRLIRLNNTKHQTSKLYKIELDPKELFNRTIDEIKELAKTRRKVDRDVTKLDVAEYIETNKNAKPEGKSVVVGDIEEIEGVRGLDQVDFSKCPQDTPRCIYGLMQGIMMPGIGERHHIFLHLGNFLRNKGFAKEHVFSALTATAKLNEDLYPEHNKFSDFEIKKSVLNMVFRNGAFNKGGWGMSPDDAVFAKYCKLIGKYTNLSCKMHEVASENGTVVNIKDISSSFGAFAENFEKNIVQTGIKFIDEHMKITSGTLNLLVGAPGSGKTTVALNMLEKANALGINCMFFSLDMHKNLVYLKLAQKLTDYKQDEIFQIFKTKDEAKKDEINKAIAAKYDKTYFDFTGTMSMDDMKDRVLATEEATGKKIKLVLVDYASRISSEYSDSYANAKYNALRSKDVADETDAAWLIICQVSRNTGDGSNPLRTKRAAKDAGDWEEAATNVITCWRPFMGQDGQEIILEEGKDDEQVIECQDRVIRLFLAKNRMGRELEMPLKWDGAKGLVEDFDDEEKLEYMEELGNFEDKVRKQMYLRR